MYMYIYVLYRNTYFMACENLIFMKFADLVIRPQNFFPVKLQEA